MGAGKIAKTTKGNEIRMGTCVIVFCVLEILFATL